jgi:outer membrane protein assembly factor BamB
MVASVLGMRRKTWALSSLAATVLVAGGAGAAWWAVHQRTGDIHRGGEEPFTLTSDAPVSSDKDGKHRKHHGFDPGPAWPVYGRNMSRTRAATDLSSIVPPYRVEWKVAPGFLEYPPSYKDGVLYLTTNNGFASARSVLTGKPLWDLRIGARVTGEPAIVGNRVYFGARNKIIYALGARTGHAVWRRHLPYAMESSPAFDDSRLYMSDLGGHVRALDLDTGRILWTFTASGAVKHGPALSGGRLYFGDYSGVMYCLRASDGKLIWETHTHGLSSGFRSGHFYSTPAVAYGRVYIGNTDDKVYSFVASNGDVAWTQTLPDWAYGSPAVSGGRVFATSWDGTIAALSARTGAPLWRHRLPGNTISSPTVIGPYVYVADRGASISSTHGDLFAYRVGDGHAVWRFPDGRFSTVIAAAGRLIVAGTLHLYALQPRRS